MRNIKLKVLTGVLMFSVLLWGCQGQRYEGTVSTTLYEDETMKSGFFKPILEAKLPEGFPRPSVVGKIVIKQYPVLRQVRVDKGDNSDSMFMALFNHIKKHDIAMTAPVEISFEQNSPEVEMEREAMAFYYQNRRLGLLGMDDGVEVAETEKGLYLSIALRGGYDDPRFAKSAKQLADWLREHENEYEQAGPPRALAYNSPFMLGFLKYSEVQIPINRL